MISDPPDAEHSPGHAEPGYYAPRFGAALQQARQRARLSVREAARRANVSEGLWRQLEKGYRQVTADVRVPTNPRSETVVAVAQAVDWNPLEALDRWGRRKDMARLRLTGSLVGPELEDESYVAHDPEPSGDQKLVTEARLREEMDRVRDEIAEIIRKELRGR